MSGATSRSTPPSPTSQTFPSSSGAGDPELAIASARSSDESAEMSQPLYRSSESDPASPFNNPPSRSHSQSHSDSHSHSHSDSPSPAPDYDDDERNVVVMRDNGHHHNHGGVHGVPMPQSPPAQSPHIEETKRMLPRSGSSTSTGVAPIGHSLAVDHLRHGQSQHIRPRSTMSNGNTGTVKRGSMVLYRLASDPDPASLRGSTYTSSTPTPGPGMPGDDEKDFLPPPRVPFAREQRREGSLNSMGSRDSTWSMRHSVISFASDSKYPMMDYTAVAGGASAPLAAAAASIAGFGHKGGLVPYEYDPDSDTPSDDEDPLHDPNVPLPSKYLSGTPWRGFMNIFALIVLMFALMALFIAYPVITFIKNAHLNSLIDGNIRINSTGQAPSLINLPQMIDPVTPDSAKTRTGFDGFDYELVFSDEFETDGRTFYPGDDPFWEGVDLWYGATADLEWYDPVQVSTKGGNLVITMDTADTTQAGLTSGSTAPFTVDQNHGLQYRSGMLQSWNKFCFRGGYFEVRVVLPGPNENTKGYWPGIWTMGNLGRPGYGGTTDGMWPYTYDSCDVGTFPNQTNKDGVTPAAAHFSSYSKDKYNDELSWLSGQKLSACTCPGTGAEHPNSEGSGSNGNTYKGRGAPEIDVLEAEINKLAGVGQVVSQSAQFAPFTHDYVFGNSTTAMWNVYNSSITTTNNYHGSAVQQAVSALTDVPSGNFQGLGDQKEFVVYGFEYRPSTPGTQDGFITWVANGQATATMGAAAVGPDPIDGSGTPGYAGANGGTGVGQRLIPEEPMSLILNLGISPNWQDPDLSTMMFPAELLIDYVRVYQRKGEISTTCDPDGYPTSQYINDHIDVYSNPNLTVWPTDKYPKPKNSLWDGC